MHGKNEIIMLLLKSVNSEQNETLDISVHCVRLHQKCKTYSTKRQVETFCK